MYFITQHKKTADIDYSPLTNSMVSGMSDILYFKVFQKRIKEEIWAY